MIAGLGVDLSNLIGPAVARGVHVRGGLEDAPFGCEKTNRELIADSVRLVEAAGGQPASAAEVRAGLAAEAPQAIHAARLYTRILAQMLADQALIHLPYGGIYLIGGMSQALAPVIKAAHRIARIKDFTGRTAPDVIT